MEFLNDLTIPAALALDAMVGDPLWLPHPIRWMGRAIEICEPVFRKLFKNEIWAGGLFAAALIFSCWAVALLLKRFAFAVDPVAGSIFEVVLLFYCLSARSLFQAGMEIHHLLQKGCVDVARSKVAMIVGRDVEKYGPDDIARAAVETVAENFVDGVLSPLFFAAIGGAPLALTFKMVNTLDSMVGYKNTRYMRFGRMAARIDDWANFFPARLSVPIIALATQLLAGRNGLRVIQTGFKEGHRHSSPNAGYPEAAFAGALAVKLNGPNFYGGRLVDKPYIGIAFNSVRIHQIQSACQLMMLSSLLGCVAAWWLGLIWH